MSETFKQDLSASVVGSGSLTHRLIESDNIHVLQDALEKDIFSLKGKVDLCYIDPPYNTGNTTAQSFTYNDAFGSSNAWIDFMRQRLEPLKVILKPTGVVVISIDDSEVHHLRVLCDEVFGSKNFIAQLVVDGGNPKNNARFFSITHEYMLVYAVNKDALLKSGITWRTHREGIDVLLDEYKKLQAKHKSDYAAITAHLKEWVKTQDLSKRLKLFYNADKRGLYTYVDLSTPGKNGRRYDVLHPVTQKSTQVPARGWGISEEKMRQLIVEDRIIFGADESFQPLKKHYLQDKKDQVQKGILAYPSRSSTHLLERLLGRRSSFNNPKNLQMMQDLISLIVPKNGLVLDYFGGSGTTGHAVIAANAEDVGARKFVVVTSDENNIFDEVTLPRLQKALLLTKSDASLQVFRAE